MTIIERVWIISQLASFTLSMAVFLGVHIQYLYATAYFSIVVSLSISLYQSLLLQKQQKEKANGSNGEAQNNIPQRQPLTDLNSYIFEAKRLYSIAKPHLKPLMTNQSTPYLVLAILQWLLLKKLVFSLLPFSTFSFFHVLTHVRNYVLPSVSFISTQTKEKLKTKLNKLSVSLSPNALLVAAYSEIACFVIYTGTALSGILLTLIGKGSGFFMNWFAVIVWYVFLNVRYDESLVMKKVVHNLTAMIDGFMADPRVPPQLKAYWDQSKYFVAVFFQTIKMKLQ